MIWWLFVWACTPSAPPPPSPDVATPAPAPTSAPLPPGPAFVGTLGGGLIRVDAGRFERLQGGPEDVELLASGASGTVWVYGDSALWRVADHTVVRVAGVPAPAGLEAIAVDEGDRVWGVGFLTAGVLDGDRWIAVPRSELPAEQLEGVIANEQGVTLLSRYALHRRLASGWSTVDLSAWVPGLVFTDELVRLGDGSWRVTWMAEDARSGMLEIRGDTFEPAEEPHAFSPEGQSLAVTPRGHLATARRGGVVVSVPGQPRSLSPRDHGYQARAIDALAVDGRGRVWMGTDLGLVVVPEEGRAVQWSPGTVPELSGPIRALLVRGDGPALPAAAPQATATVRGRVLAPSGTPVADAPMALCDDASMVFVKHPCEGGRTWLDGKTDGEGRFTLPGVPFGQLTLVLRHEERWSLVFGVACCTEVRPGQPVDLGDLRLRAPPEHDGAVPP